MAKPLLTNAEKQAVKDRLGRLGSRSAPVLPPPPGRVRLFVDRILLRPGPR